MQKHTYVILFLLIFFNASAQDNGGFESWTTEFNYENPDEWQTMNLLNLTTPPNPVSCFKAVGIDKHSGNYALKIKSVHINNNPAPTAVPDTFGCAFKGKITISPVTFKAGYPYTNRPEKLEFYSKYSPVGNDTALVEVLLKRWTGTFTDTIAKATMNLTASSVYGLRELPLTYLNNELPDSAVIAFYSSRDSLTARVGSTLYVDDVLFSGWVGLNEISKSAATNVFPNPAKEYITIQTTLKEAHNLRLVNALGAEAGVYSIDNQGFVVDVHSFIPGTYFYEIRSIGNRVVDIGKFSVIK